MAAAFSRIGAWLPRGWRDLFVQLALYILADTTYELSRGMAEGKATLAFANGERIIDLERATHSLFEPSFQTLVMSQDFLIDIANQVYLNSQFTVATSFLIWLYLFRNDAYYFFRNMLFVAMGLALVGYIGFPTAPPRMYPEFGFVDTVNDFSSINHDSALAKLFINPFAAVPSMHCAVSLMIGGTGFMVCRNGFARAFWAGWPLIVAWATVVTANHYWFDAVAGWAVAGASFLIAARVIAQFRPESWAWSQVADHQRLTTNGRKRPATASPGDLS